MSDVQTILALDPGGTTGWAAYRGNPNRPYKLEEFWHGQLEGEHHLELWELLGHWQTQDFTVVCESFEFRQGSQSFRHNIVLDSKEYIGITKLFRQERMTKLGQQLVFQTAGKAKPFVTDDKLRIMGIWDLTKGLRHARDAYRHLITYMVQKERRMDLIESWKSL